MSYRRIVCLSTEAVETLYLLGAEDCVAGISGFTTRPMRARKEKPKVSGFSSAKIDRILAVTPDLVIAFSDLQAEIARDLVRAGVEVHVFNQRDLAGILRMIRSLATLVGRAERGEQLTAELQARLERVRGFVINRFRGDIGLLQPGVEWLVRKTGKPVFGVIPFLHGLHLEAEDSIKTEQAEKLAGKLLRVIVPVLPRISNHTDLDALRAHPQVDLQFIAPGMRIPRADLIVLPGSKSVQADLAWLDREGWTVEIQRHLRYGGKVIGICGGMQMLGARLNDPLGLEGAAGSRPGLGLLDFETTLNPEKCLQQVRGRLVGSGARVAGYEIHMGASTGPALARAAIEVDDGRRDGALSEDGQIFTTYLHGLFDAPEASSALLAWAGLERPLALDYDAMREASIDRLADAMTEHLNIEQLLAEVG